MRLIGHLSGEQDATVFSQYLLTEGIENRVEPETAESWAIWVYDEELIDRAKRILTEFRADPQGSHYVAAGPAARQRLAEMEKLEKIAAKRHFDRSRIFKSTGVYGLGRVTAVLLATSIVFYLLRSGGFYAVWELDFARVQRGELWRLVTPVFLHFNLLHIIFNMMWLYDLGSMIEARHSSRYLTGMFLVLAITSNLAEYQVSGAGFGGMSGVVYGFLGYIWIRGKFDPSAGLFLHPQTVVLMIAWFFLGIFVRGMHTANFAHGAGLFVGMAWAFTVVFLVPRRRG